MKNIIFFILATIVIEVRGAITKEQAIPKVTVRLVEKSWRPKFFKPGTDDPLPGFPGNYTQLYKIFKNYKHFTFVSQPLISATKIFDDPNYNATQPSVILTHPMTIGNSMFISHVVGVLALRNLHKHYNVFSMHAPWLSLQFQTSCARTALGLRPFYKPVAEAFATFLLDGISLGKIRPEQINFIGFSYAATLNAYIAREIRDNTGRLTHTLMSLDAFQYNHNNRFFTAVSNRDAMYVHMFHSSSRFGGTMDRIGTVDVVLNNGYMQPGCESSYVNVGVGCSHRRSVVLFIFAILNSGNVVGRQCDSWDAFSQCQCNDTTKPMLVVSFPVNTEARGVYYVRTSNELPYALGTKGAYCEDKANKKHFINK